MPDRLAEIINVKEFGAVGDGSTNDTTAIQNAIQEAFNRGGGQVYFPGPARYRLGGVGFLTVGSNSTTARVDLVGNGKSGTLIIGTSARTPIISKGVGTNDNIGRIQGLAVVNASGPPALIKIEGSAQSVIDVDLSSIQGGKCGLDASAATCAFVSGCVGGGGVGANAANNPPIGPPANTVGMYLGNCCAAYNCRLQGGLDIAYALSGNAPAVIACSSEVTMTGIRVGWGLIAGVPSEVTAFGFCIHGYQCESTGSVDTAGGAGIVLYNCQGGIISGVQMQGQGGGSVPGAPIRSMSWAATAGGTATVTTTGNHNIPAGNFILQLFTTGNTDWIPSYGGSPGFLLAQSTGGAAPTTFTYALPRGAPPAAWTGNDAKWSYAQYFAIRFRKVSGVSIQGCNCGINSGLATYDFNYNDASQNHSNNVLYGGQSSSTLFGGVWLPQNTNTHQRSILAGWTFYGAGGQPNALDGFGWRPVGYTVASPAGNMVFADLPGQAGVFQDGPFVGQEFDILDSPLANFTHFASRVVTGGGTNKVRLRWDGTSSWIITG